MHLWWSTWNIIYYEKHYKEGFTFLSLLKTNDLYTLWIFICTNTLLAHSFNLDLNLPIFQADVLEYYDQTVNSPSGSFYIPAVLRVCAKFFSFFFSSFKFSPFLSNDVIAEFFIISDCLFLLHWSDSSLLQVPHLLQVVKRRRIKSTLSRKNILYRDNYTCQ